CVRGRITRVITVSITPGPNWFFDIW
nr:immunoglobulin heavy chain junction region [Macaca mulatta]MOW48374.1 immunoglobulin heavy chain junction region [Macaca mulatta]